jgi:hypothetical protein
METEVKTRGRKNLPEAERQNMAIRREEAKNEKQVALAALANPQFVNPKLWSKVDPSLVEAVKAAIAKSEDKVKAKQISALRAQLAELEG